MSDAYAQVIDALSKCRKILITTHVKPDGDALGSVAAMVMGLRKKGIESQVILLSHLPRKYSFVFEENQISHINVEKAWPADLSLDNFDAVLVMDTGTWSQLPGLKEKVLAYRKPKIVIDHHLTQENWADVKLVVKEAAAAGEIAAELLESWEIPLDKQIASVLYVAIVSDTGWFQFSNTRPFTLRLAANLMEAGADTDRLYQLLYQNEKTERVLLQTRAMDSMELVADGKVAVMRIRASDFEATNSNVGDTENLINIPLQIAKVQASILIVEPKEPPHQPIRISLRSKGQLDVARFAEKFGGGGHARAAGLKIEGDFDQAHDRVVAELIKAFA